MDLAVETARQDVFGAHLVMVPNPPYHPDGDFHLAGTALSLEGTPRLTFGNIAVYDTALFAELPRGVKLKMLPLYQRAIAAQRLAGELYTGVWSDVGTIDRLNALQ